MRSGVILREVPFSHGLGRPTWSGAGTDMGGVGHGGVGHGGVDGIFEKNGVT